MGLIELWQKVKDSLTPNIIREWDLGVAMERLSSIDDYADANGGSLPLELEQEEQDLTALVRRECARLNIPVPLIAQEYSPAAKATAELS